MHALRARARCPRAPLLLALRAVAALALIVPSTAAARLPSRIYSLGHYQLHVSISYRAEAASSAPTNNPAPQPGTGLSPYWNFTTQSESAMLHASWTDRLELNRIGLGSPLYSVQPVHYPRALGEIHNYELHTLGSPGIEAAVSDSYTGTYYSAVSEGCSSPQPCQVSYTPTPFTCTLSERNTEVAGAVRVQWLQGGNLARESYRGYLDPLRPGAVFIGVDFALLPAQENSPKTGSKGGHGGEGGTGGGFLAPHCPSGVNVFEPWLSESGLLSPLPEEPANQAVKQESRLVVISLAGLIDHGSATSSFTGPATSPTGCCTGSTSYTLTITARRVR
jgi:hypothetical protein